MPIEDGELVARALRGSQEAYRDLVLRYQRPIFGLIARMVRDPGEAEDLAQEVFVKAFAALESYDRRRKFSSWLFKIAHNAAIDQLRRRRLETVPLETPEDDRPDPLTLVADPASEGPERALGRRHLAAAIEGAVAGLRAEYREVVILRFQQGLQYEEIAGVTGLPLGTVKTHLHRARKALVRHLEAAGWTPQGL